LAVERLEADQTPIRSLTSLDGIRHLSKVHA
jgi:hypothetical protein